MYNQVGTIVMQEHQKVSFGSCANYFPLYTTNEIKLYLCLIGMIVSVATYKPLDLYYKSLFLQFLQASIPYGRFILGLPQENVHMGLLTQCTYQDQFIPKETVNAENNIESVIL